MTSIYVQTVKSMPETKKESNKLRQPKYQPPRLVKRNSAATADTILDSLLDEEDFDWETFLDDGYHSFSYSAGDELEEDDETYSLADEQTVKCGNTSSFKQDEDRLEDIEVMPGLLLPLRGSFETMQAVLDNYLVSTSCYCCGQTMHCVRDTDYVLCSKCYVVIPVLQSDDSDGSDGGTSSVGLGLNDEELEECRKLAFCRSSASE